MSGWHVQQKFRGVHTTLGFTELSVSKRRSPRALLRRLMGKLPAGERQAYAYLKEG